MPSKHKGWIGVDFDGTLATFVDRGAVLGPPIPPMVYRVQLWLRNGYDVRIFTSRVSHKDQEKRKAVVEALEAWCKKHIGKVLPITNEKDFNMIELWDDKAITVIRNTGLSLREHMKRSRKRL
jgi:hypothetical protein